jgi:diguanylate cyclase (GGDEF)-like protein
MTQSATAGKIEILQNKLRMAVNFPSPPAIAMQIIELASDPEINVSALAAMISRDAGLAAKVLRVANSPIYCKRRRSDNLRQALVVLGLNAATTLALSFSLVSTYQRGNGVGIDYRRYWRRAILIANAARAFGERFSEQSSEDLFLAALLQDIGILALDRVQPDLYQTLKLEASHAEIIAHERGALGTDHAALGGWLLRQWNLSDALCSTVEASHDVQSLPDGSAHAEAARCLALATQCGDILLGGGAQPLAAAMDELEARSREWLGLDAAALAEVLTSLVAEIPEIERLFETPILPGDAAAAILDQARELLTLRNLQALEEVTTLKASSQQLASRTAELESKTRRDALTGAYSRGHLDVQCQTEFDNAVAGSWPLSVAFVDLDNFKRVNDTWGHAAGDAVLIAAARIMMDSTRDSDFVGRYGGDEFLLILPGVGADLARRVCDRILTRLRAWEGGGEEGTLRMSASIGLATHVPNEPFGTAADLIRAADRCVYAAKSAGRDRMIAQGGASAQPTLREARG